jgi:hypothetical protein
MTFIFDRLLHFFLKDEEVRRNSVMFDMLFVKLCHPLSVCISILDEKCKRLTDKERVEVKERIEPEKRFVAMFKCWTLYCFFCFCFFKVQRINECVHSIQCEGSLYFLLDLDCRILLSFVVCYILVPLPFRFPKSVELVRKLRDALLRRKKWGNIWQRFFLAFFS